MNTLLAVAIIVTTLAATVWLIMLVRRDRPAAPPADQVDWRSERLSWRHVGIS